MTPANRRCFISSARWKRRQLKAVTWAVRRVGPRELKAVIPRRSVSGVTAWTDVSALPVIVGRKTEPAAGLLDGAGGWTTSRSPTPD